MIRACIASVVAFVLLGATPARALDPTRSIDQMFHTAYTRDNGLLSAVNTIAQTPDGYLWVGTASGLYRFDGVRFERIAADRLLSLNIHALMTSSDGDLWIGYFNGGVSRRRGSAIVNFPPSAGGPPGRISRLKEALRGGGLWAFAVPDLYRFDGRQWLTIAGDWGTGGVWSVEPARDGTVWAKNGELVAYCRPGCARFATARGYAGGVMGLARGADGRVWTSDSRAPGRMYAMPDVAGLSDDAIPSPTYGAQISDRIRGRIYLDRDDTLWNINVQHGVLRARSIVDAAGAPADAFTMQDGLSSDFVTEFYEDREGSVWIGTNLGLDRFRPANVVIERRMPAVASPYSYRAARTPTALYVFAPTSEDNSSPMASDSGPLYRVTADGAVQRVIAEVYRPECTAPFSDGSLGIGTNHGLSRLVGDRLVAERLPPEVPESTTVFSFAEDAEGNLWAGLFGHGVWRRERGEWSQIPDLQNCSATNLAPDREAMWITCREDRNLVRFANGRTELFMPDAGPNIGAISMIHPDARGVLLGGESGLARHDGRGFHTLRTERIAELSFVTGVVEAEGQTWIRTQSGILRFATADLERALADHMVRPSYEVFDRQDSLQGDTEQYTGIQTAFPGPDGKIWFITDRSMVWIDPHHIYHNPLPPPVAIRSLTVGERTYTSPTTLNLAKGTSNLQIDYAALSFVEPSRVRFRYKLDGVDDDWVDPGTRRQAFYTKLGPGTHRFQVIASNDAGVWNRTGATLAFTIPPTFVQSIWFKVMCVLAAAMLLWLLYLLRLRQVTAQIRGRLEERIQERERIARDLHDTLLQNLLSASLQLSLANSTIPADAPAKPLVEKILELLRRGVDEGRNAVRDLRTRGSEQRAFERAFAQIPQDLEVDQKIEYRLIVEGTRRALRPLVREEVYRIGREAVANAFRHSRGSVVETVLEYAHDRFRMVVRDDGRGMDPEVARAGREGHWGLSGMRERSEKIRAHLKVLSAAGAGTEIDLIVPGSSAFEPSTTRPWAEWLHGFYRRREPE